MKNLFRSLLLTTVALGFVTIPTNARATVILGEPAHFEPAVGQPLFPAGNLNVFKQYVVGFDASEHIGDTVEIDLLFTTLKFGGEVSAGFQANFGFEFGLCLGGNADYDMNFQPMVILPDMYPSEIPIPITIAADLQPGSHFTTTFPPLGKMYADLILHLEADVDAEACVFGCFDPLSFLDFPLRSCDIPALPSGDKMFNLSKRCDPALNAERYCAIELASFNRNDQNKARMLNVGADNLAEFFAEPYKEFSLGSSDGKTFTANPGDNTITISGNTFPGGSPVRVSSSGTLPLGLKKTQIYYTTAAGNKISLAKSAGGPAISISSVGDGTHTIKLPDVEEDPDPLEGRYGSLAIAAPTINTDSNDDRRLNTPRSLRSTGAEDVVGAGVDLAQMATDFLFPPVLPPLSDSGSLGPIDWDYTLASLDIGPAVQLQMDFEMTWDLVVTEMTFSNPVRLFTSDGATFPLSSTGTPASSELYADTGAPADTFHLTNTGPHALPLIYLNTSTDGLGKPLPAAQQQAVDMTIKYKLVPKLHTIVSLPFIGKVSYDVLGASASISRVGDLGFGPIVEGDHKFKLGDFEVYNGGATAIDTSSTQRGTISFTMRSEGPPNFDWNPSQLGRSSTRDWIQKINYPNPGDQDKTNWRELLSSLETGFPGNGLSTLSSAMIDSDELGPTLRDPITIESLNVAADNLLQINEHFTSGKPVTKLTVGGLIENQGTVSVIGDSIMKMGSRESVLCGSGKVQLHGGGTLQGASMDANAAVCNYNTIEGAGYALDQPFSNAFFSFTDRFQTTTHNMGRIVARGNFGNAGTNQIKLEILAGGSTLNSTWEITTPEGAAVRSGDVPYSSTLTLADGDYVFTIFDNLDNVDGVWGGSYTIHSSSGQEIATGGSFFSKPSNSKSIYIRNGHFLKTAAYTINNHGELGSISGGRLVVDGSDLYNRIGSDITASGSGSMIEIRTKNVHHAGQMTTSSGGRIEFYPIRERSAANLLAGRSFREDCGHLFAADLGEIHLQSAQVSGGCFSAEGRGSLTTNNSVFYASVIEIGSRFNPTGTFDILGPNRNDNRWRTTGHNILTRACINNYGTLRVSGEAEFIDSELFANNGTVEVGPGGILRIRENTVATPGASAEAQSQPGCANMTATALLGGIWDVSGQIFVDGAEFKVIGSDVAPARVSSGTTNELDDTPPAYDQDLNQYVSTNPSETDPLMRPFDNSRILSEGRPAEVILRGRGSFFQPLNFLEENCGILRVVDGAEFKPRGYVLPEGGGVDGKENGDFFNKGQLLIGSPGNDQATFECRGAFNQEFAGASTVVDGFAVFASSTGTYNISGGTVSSPVAGRVFAFNRRDYKIHVASPATGTEGEQQKRVVIDIPDEITTIHEGAEITIHGAAVEFTALTDHLRTNNGKLVISGDGALNAPDYLIATEGFSNHEAFTNTGSLHVLGFQTKLTTGNYTQTGDESETRVGVGAQFLANTIDINGGDFVIEIGSRPGQIPSGSIRMFNDNGGDFGNNLVFDFKDELASENKTVDIGDTWTIISPSSPTITGIDTFEARLDGAPLPADWLPAGSHLELVQFETSNRPPRGLKLRVTPDGGFYDYDAWAADAGLDPDRALADPFRIGARGVDTNAMQFLYGTDGVEKGSPGQYQLVDFVDEGDERFAMFSYTRLFGTDADYELYLSPDLKEWIVAPMILTPSAATPVLGQLEVVTLKSIYPVTSEELYFRVRAKLNPDNFELGELPEKLINYDLWLSNFNGWLENNASPPVSYVVESGKTLFFSVNVLLNEESEQNIWGGTGPDGERNFIYSDGTELKLAVRHANLLGGSGSGLIKVTFVPTQQTPFIGSLQNEGTPYETESNDLAVEDVPYSYHIELVEKF